MQLTKYVLYISSNKFSSVTFWRGNLIVIFQGGVEITSIAHFQKNTITFEWFTPRCCMSLYNRRWMNQIWVMICIFEWWLIGKFVLCMKYFPANVEMSDQRLPLDGCLMFCDEKWIVTQMHKDRFLWLWQKCNWVENKMLITLWLIVIYVWIKEWF